VHAGLGHTSWITAAAVAMVSTNPYGDNNELKFNKRPTLIAEVFHIFIDVHVSSSLCNNATDIHFSSHKHCWLPWLLAALLDCDLCPFAMCIRFIWKRDALPIIAVHIVTVYVIHVFNILAYPTHRPK